MCAFDHTVSLASFLNGVTLREPYVDMRLVDIWDVYD